MFDSVIAINPKRETPGCPGSQAPYHLPRIWNPHVPTLDHQNGGPWTHVTHMARASYTPDMPQDDIGFYFFLYTHTCLKMILAFLMPTCIYIYIYTYTLGLKTHLLLRSGVIKTVSLLGPRSQATLTVGYDSWAHIYIYIYIAYSTDESWTY